MGMPELQDARQGQRPGVQEVRRSVDSRDRTAAARRARTRIKHDRWADELRAAGWDVKAPSRA